MIDESKIPLLEDLVSRGQLELDSDHAPVDNDEHHDIEIEQDDEAPANLEADEPATKPERTRDELTDDPSLRELIIDEEIRMILDKHMDKAYEEIVRLLNHKIS